LQSYGYCVYFMLYERNGEYSVNSASVFSGGSFNYTGPATQLNDENIFILGDPASTSKESIKAQKKVEGSLGNRLTFGGTC